MSAANDETTPDDLKPDDLKPGSDPPSAHAEPQNPAVIATDEVGPGSGGAITLIAVIFESLLGLVTIGLGWLVGVDPAARIHFDATALLVGAVATVPPVAALILLDRYPMGPFGRLQQFVRQHVVPIFRDCSWWQFALIAAAAGVGEELLCRGLLQQGLEIWLTGPLGATAAMACALVIASVLFGLAHFLTPMYAAACILIGLYLGGLYMATGNLLVPVIVHALYDLVALIYLTRGTSISTAPAGSSGQVPPPSDSP